jgi:hypothetical protein
LAGRAAQAQRYAPGFWVDGTFMRRYIIYALIVLVTLSSGLFVSAVWRSKSSPNPSEPLPLSLCELERLPEQYDGKLVRVKAVLYSDLGGPYIYDWSCGSQNIYTYPLIDLCGFDGLNSELREWSRSIGAVDSKGQGLEANVIVTGIFDRSYVDPSDDSFSHHFRIIPARIEQLSALHPRE